MGAAIPPPTPEPADPQMAQLVEVLVFMLEHQRRRIVTRRRALPGIKEATARFQEQYLRAALAASDGNITEAGDLIQLSRKHVYTLMREFQIPIRGGRAKKKGGE